MKAKPKYFQTQIKEDKNVYLGSRCAVILFQIRFHSLITSALILGLLSGGLSAAVVTWDGGAGNNKDDWSGSGGQGGNGHNNWDRNSPPIDGDSLIFAGGVKLENNNNISGLDIINLTFALDAGPFILDGNQLTFTAGGITNSSATNILQTVNMDLGLNATITVTGGSGADIAVGGIISGSGGINKTGANTLYLNVVNTYTGATSITAGALGGTGTIASASGTNGITVSSGAIIAPGNANTTGTLTFNFTSTTGRLTMNSGSGFQFHLGTAGLNINSGGVSDMLSIAGASSGDVIFNNNNIDFRGTGALGYYKIFDTSSNNSNTWTGLTVNGSGEITGGLTSSNLTSGLSAIFIMGGGSYGGTSGDIYVQVIPEPNAVLLGGLGTVLLLLRRRRV